ncbi:hypothetical protein [Rubellimicrobium sp. CFH 75288]|uniref:hypothetical protein n=1 Tax=Rubellimicrobium sp. CFH 75288 TaxID=2697034 RepID=UPI00141345F2|nr:hypothetical protein [Rubellimicrobium sp. CFH 75288]NAZ36371.1 hypothetical protein [Rubellimicrobium sp. CFH 75288]
MTRIVALVAVVAVAIFAYVWSRSDRAAESGVVTSTQTAPGGTDAGAVAVPGADANLPLAGDGSDVPAPDETGETPEQGSPGGEGDPPQPGTVPDDTANPAGDPAEPDSAAPAGTPEEAAPDGTNVDPSAAAVAPPPGTDGENAPAQATAAPPRAFVTVPADLDVLLDPAALDPEAIRAALARSGRLTPAERSSLLADLDQAQGQPEQLEAVLERIRAILTGI